MKKHIIAIVGDFYHKEEWAKASLEQAVENLPNIKVEYGSVEQMIDHINAKPDSIILFAENRLTPQSDETNLWMDSEMERAICAYVHAGGGWLAWHSGLASYEKMDAYLNMLKGYFEYHPAEHQVVTYTPVKDSLIHEQHYEAFQILDEHYFVYCDEQNTNVFLKSESVDGTSIAGWTHSYGEGKVVCFTPAHREEGLLHPNVTRLLAQSVKKVVE